VAPLGALDLTAPRAFLTPPELPAPALAFGTWQNRPIAVGDAEGQRARPALG
jgi:hypothetical protein